METHRDCRYDWLKDMYVCSPEDRTRIHFLDLVCPRSCEWRVSAVSEKPRVLRFKRSGH